MSNGKISRRNFLKAAMAGTAAVAVTPSLLAGTRTESGNKKTTRKPVKRSGKVQMAFVGIGHRGQENFKSFVKTGLIDVVAICDVDMGAKHTQEVISQCPGVPQFKDFRQMFDKLQNKIEAVCISTPDFSHFPITMDAMRRGFHVYVEKPLARTFMENELLMEAEKKYGVVTQMGNQGHSDKNYYQFKAFAEAGLLNDVTKVNAHMNNSRRWHKWDSNITRYPSAEPCPETMDWDTWLMQGHERPYNKDYHHGQWRCWFELGMGALGDWGAHILDGVHEFLDLGLPYEVEPLLLKEHNRFFFPKSTTLAFRFPARGNMPPVDINWYDGLDNLPPLPAAYGKSELDPNIPTVNGGKIQSQKVNPGKEIYKKDGVIFKGGSHGSTLSLIPSKEAEILSAKLPAVQKPSSNHFENFLLAIRGKEQVHSPFSVSAPLTQVFCLGVIAQWTGRKIEFDRETKQIVNDPIANQLLWGPLPREGWEKYYE